MKTETNLKAMPSCGVLAAGLGIIGLTLAGGATTVAQEWAPLRPAMDQPLLDNPKRAWGTDYTNWVEIGVGGMWTQGSEAEAMRRHTLPDGVFGGIQDLHYEQALPDKATLEIDGRAMGGMEDYALGITYDRPGLGFVRGGIRQYREWYDRHGGFFPSTDTWLEPFERDVHLDRGEIWFETGLRIENVPEVTFRYRHLYRDGLKDSTIWGDANVFLGTTTAADRRNIVPAYRDIDEERNIFELDVKHQIAQTGFGVGVRYEDSGQQNQLRFLRRPGEIPPAVTGSGAQRNVNQRDDVDTDLLNVHAFVEHRISPRALFTAGYAFTTLDTDLRGNRIIGEGFEAVYDPLFARRQPFDEGFFDLSGGGNLYQHAANLNLLLTPMDYLSILPSVRVSSEEESADSWFIETNVGQPPARRATADPLHAENNNDWLDVTAALEARYTGLSNCLFYVRGEFTHSQGSQVEHETDFGATNGIVRELVQDVDQERFIQKYVGGFNWYPLRRLSVGLQYYHKIRESNYDPSAAMTTGEDAYPGFLHDQNFETDDANIRVTIRPLNNLTLISRFDIQYSTIDTTAGNLGESQSARIRSHIFSQSISWAPVNRLYLQLGGSYCSDQTETPLDRIPGGPDLIRDSENGYFNANALVGIALNDRTDLQFQYFYYLADNDSGQDSDGVFYNAGSQEHGVTATLARQITSALRWTLKYGFFTNNDDTYGGHKDYDAHMVYTSMQLRF